MCAGQLARAMMYFFIATVFHFLATVFHFFATPSFFAIFFSCTNLYSEATQL